MMPPYQQRVLAEQDDLYIKWVNLGSFLANATQEQVDLMSIEEYRRLSKQYAIMKQYIDILTERIDNFN